MSIGFTWDDARPTIVAGSSGRPTPDVQRQQTRDSHRRYRFRNVGSGESRDPRSPPTAILASGDFALEPGIIDWVVFNVNGHPFVGRIEGWTLGNRPAPQDAIMLQPEIPMLPGAVRGILSHPRRVAPATGAVPL